ncbi:MAG TPA: hypothetical protein VJ840_17595 [Gemmatimonadaceae bacterium]|nr:hypothetical protein [Gemmatimonadaceae bacterium]
MDTSRKAPAPADSDVMLAMAPMPSRTVLFRRLARSFMIAASVIGGGLVLGMIGYHNFGHLVWRESFYYASMILAGEGPPSDPVGLSAAEIGRLHVFAGVYALFSGVTFITMIGVLFAPVLQRFLHRFHLELASQDVDDS